MNNNFKKNKGITLVALVITIIILLILAGITLVALTGENGLFSKSKQAVERNKEEAAREKISHALGEYMIDINSVDMPDTEKDSYLLEILNNVGPTTVAENANYYEVLVDGYIFWIHRETLDVVSKEIDNEIEATEVKIKESSKNMTVNVGETVSIDIEVQPEGASKKSLEYISNNSEIAEVNYGVVKGIAQGTATITVKTKSGQEETCTITVNDRTPSEILYSWEELDKIARAISNTTKYNKDTKTIMVTIEGIEKILTVGDWKEIDGKKVRILGFNHDTLTSRNSYEGGTLTGKAGISFEYVDCLIDSAQMNNKNVEEGGWTSKDLYKILNTNTDAKYKEIQSMGIPIKNVVKTANASATGDSRLRTNDYLWLLSCTEIYGTSAKQGMESAFAYKKEDEQYKYYSDLKPNYATSYDFLRKVNQNGNVVEWWLRSRAHGYAYAFCNISSGKCDMRDQSWSKGIAPGFAI